MSNKSIGTDFESELCNTLKSQGFWCKMLSTGTGQAADIVAVKNNIAYFYECKRCEGDTFSCARIECNQSTAMRYNLSCGNTNYYIAIKFPQGVRILLLSDALERKSIKHNDELRFVE